MSEGVCEWSYDEWPEEWHTDCGDTMRAWLSTPQEEGWAFCPFCGRKIKEVSDGS